MRRGGVWSSRGLPSGIFSGMAQDGCQERTRFLQLEALITSKPLGILYDSVRGVTLYSRIHQMLSANIRFLQSHL